MEANKEAGIVIAIKPRGISSYGVVRYAKKVFNIKKIGHLGTLDPLACGVLVLLIGRAATKLNSKLSEGSKIYRTVFTFGTQTETADAEGKVVNTTDVLPTKEQIEQQIQTMVGQLDQPVPRFSAVHINGQRAYDLARQGKEFEVPTKKINVHSFKLIKQISKTDFLFDIECSTGTYIRALAEMLAAKVNSYAFASTILRTKVGCFDIKNSVNFKKMDKKSLIDVGDVIN